MGRLPQPRASAMGCHMAMTTGERTRFCVGPTRSLPVLVRESAFPSLMKAAEAGLIRSGWRAPERISSTTSPDPIGIAWTWIRFPAAVRWFPWLKAAVVSSIQFCFSDPYVKTSPTVELSEITPPLEDGVGEDWEE